MTKNQYDCRFQAKNYNDSEIQALAAHLRVQSNAVTRTFLPDCVRAPSLATGVIVFASTVAKFGTSWASWASAGCAIETTAAVAGGMVC